MDKVDIEVFFSAVDSFYFRGSRPHSAAGASRLASDFPPAVSTLVGSIRTRLGDALQVDWSRLTEKSGQAHSDQRFEGLDVGQLIGSSQDTGELNFGAPVLYKGAQRLYPVPAVLLQTSEEQLTRLVLGDAVRCDLGHVRLAQLPTGVANAKPIENAWLTEEGLQRFLNGELPKKQHIVQQSDLFHHEERLGIGRNVQLATVKSGLLYQTEHVRLAPDVEIGIRVRLPKIVLTPFVESIAQQPLQRFGGEGRMAYLRVEKGISPKKLSTDKPVRLLMLLTDMLADTDFAQQPISALQRTQHQGIDCWEGKLNGIAVRLWSVVSAKTRRIGGWDVRHNRPREVQSYIPAGSCFFIEAMDDQTLNVLTGHQLGRCTDFDFGTLVCAH